MPAADPETETKAEAEAVAGADTEECAHPVNMPILNRYFDSMENNSLYYIGIWLWRKHCAYHEVLLALLPVLASGLDCILSARLLQVLKPACSVQKSVYFFECDTLKGRCEVTSLTLHSGMHWHTWHPP